MPIVESLKKGFAYAYSSGLSVPLSAYYVLLFALFLAPVAIGLPITVFKALSASSFGQAMSVASVSVSLAWKYYLLFFAAAALACVFAEAALIAAARDFSGEKMNLKSVASNAAEPFAHLLLQKAVVATLFLASDFVFSYGAQVVFLIPLMGFLKMASFAFAFLAFSFAPFCLVLLKKGAAYSLDYSISAFLRKPARAILFLTAASASALAIIGICAIPAMLAFPAELFSLVLSAKFERALLLSTTLSTITAAIFLLGTCFARLFYIGACAEFFKTELAPPQPAPGNRKKQAAKKQ